jgi:hypothetical protein
LIGSQPSRWTATVDGVWPGSTRRPTFCKVRNSQSGTEDLSRVATAIVYNKIDIYSN